MLKYFKVLLPCSMLMMALHLANHPVQAQTATDSFTVTATVVSSCAVVANDLSFGNYDINSGTPTDQTTTLDVTCTNGTSYTVGLSDGIGSGATTAARVMTGSTDTLNYTLYRDASHSQLWGSNIGSDTVAGTGTGSVQTLTVFGRIPASQSVDTGSYTDTIQVTVTF